METRHIGRIVTGSLVGGLVVALALVLGPVAGAQEHVITGTILLTLCRELGLAGDALDAADRAATAMGVRDCQLHGGGRRCASRLAPSGVAIDALGWVWPPLFLALLAGTIMRVHRDLHSRSRSWVVYPLLGVYALGAVGGGYQTIRESLDRRLYVAPGQLIDIGGHRLHLHCAGSGTPTVLLESGLGETAAYWGWISPAVASDTRVCVYDRAGRGWSDPVSVPQDGVAVATDLHMLLDRAHVPGPFVLVGHSSGAQYVRIFAGRYPEQVAGMVLLDGQPAEAFEGLPWYPMFYSVFHRIFAVLPTLARLGVGRVLVHADLALPAHARDIQRVHHASPRLYRSLRDEFDELPTALPRPDRFRASATGRSSWSPLPRMRSRDGCPCRTGWRRYPRTAATASCPIPMTRSSQIRPPHKRQSTPFVTLCMRCAPTFLWTNRSNAEIKELLMLPYVVGIVLSIGVALFARWVGFDRDRAFYPTVLIVIASVLRAVRRNDRLASDGGPGVSRDGRVRDRGRCRIQGKRMDYRWRAGWPWRSGRRSRPHRRERWCARLVAGMVSRV